MTDFNFSKWNIILGWSAFAIALLVYCLTVEPTVSFWDCGEYISTAAKLEVGHPPGAPFFQLVGAFFALFAPGADKVALMVNMVSVLSSAFTILFMYWSCTILLKNMVSSFTGFNRQNAVMVLGSSFIGCLAFTFSDSFWFSATEAEVYAMASLFIAVMLWAGLRWAEEMHHPRGNRWLLFLSLLTGLSFGVHFLALLTIPSIGLIYYFRNYKTITVKNFIIANIVIVAILFFVFMFLLPYTLTLFAKSEIFMVNIFGLPFNSGTIFAALCIAALFYFGLRYTRKKQMPLYNTILLCILFIFSGFSTWLMLPIRANAHVVINENPPTDAAEVLAYYNREQYGEQKTFYGPMYTEAYANLDENKPYEDDKPNYERDYTTGKYVIVNNYKNARQNADESHNGFLPRMNNPKSAVQYMAFAGPPEFRLNPNYPFERELHNYGIDINSITDEEAYNAISQIKGELERIIAEFKAAYNSGEMGNEEYHKFLQSYKQYLIIEKPSLADNLHFMFEYQFGYMYWRYLMWNFAGRQNDIQGQYDNMDGNWISGFDFIDEPRLGPQDSLTQDMLNNKGRNVYYLLPFLLGIAGLLFHARKDPKSFYIVLTLFLFTSFALKIFLNEKAFEVRERDYVLVGSFYAFAIWIAFGVFALYYYTKKYIAPKIAIPAVLAITLLAAPVLMAKENWDDHDRSGRYTALALAKAMLDSCPENAILFTIGDNDTFLLWYAQEIEHYRTDVRVVCSTLLPTDWHINQMTRKAYESEPLPISFKPEQYRAGTRDYVIYMPRTTARMHIMDFMDFLKLDDERASVEFESGQRVNFYPTNKIRVPVNKEYIIKKEIVSPQRYDSIVPHIDIDLPTDALYKNSLIMLDIVSNNNWERPICFVGGSLDDAEYIWMKDYLQLEGLIYRLVPVKTPVPEDSPMDMGYIDSDKMYDIVMKWDWGNSGSPNIYHDPQSLRNSISYRKNLANLLETLLNEEKHDKAKKVIDLAMNNMPPELYKYYFMAEPFADGYYRTGQQEKARELLRLLITKYKENLTYFKSLPASSQNSGYLNIIRDIESYRSLLYIMKDNRDDDFYHSAKQDFNRYNKMFERFGRDDE